MRARCRCRCSPSAPRSTTTPARSRSHPHGCSGTGCNGRTDSRRILVACGGAISFSTLVMSWASPANTRASVGGARRRQPSSNHCTPIPPPSRHGSAGPDTSTTRHRRGGQLAPTRLNPCCSAVHHRSSAPAIWSRGGVFSQFLPPYRGDNTDDHVLGHSRAERPSPLRAVSEHLSGCGSTSASR
jgi:hypothetical protein